MPELPEVVTVVNALKSEVIGKKIKNVLARDTNFIKEISFSDFQKFLIDATIIDIQNRAKHILIFLDNQKVILSHLRMNGKYFTYKSLQWGKHDYISFIFSDNTVLNYNDSRKFGTFMVRDKHALFTTKPLSNLGPEPSSINVDDFYQKIRKSTRVIKAILLDQKIISGLGNIYADEICFATKIFPGKKANLITKKEAKLIIYFSQKILQESIKLGGSSISSYTSLNSKEGKFQNFLKVHTKQNFPCTKCRTKILKTVVAGRGTYFCPVCQNPNN
ncbi:DNA-formamidopyrimidine glycosylase [Mycoplasma flocculare]|uniref:Formamidopyrimidine-DNA glycosylase n=1 Tax=Mesomycoplasma flocculare ATCC 27399 TaxID=743971 RepID=A0A0A8E7T0_MESFC|nr:DNA-formamidopyrimidine glycosylase [Mesomycoplasma flocculare]AJC50048.1 formamidopyrimidine-DNA glycosylase [Mesomycoplasma flocculare ATCC 27399]ENX51015.1 foramidopyrimidine DNA gycosylase [Mesomycoplasma flocculare ATCC 27716]MXR13551.1 DNA-formamidopyrimidine glycosylase [Mesomycoplasma flocculare]MXR56129.1 DNA-formamidopyrimidine glycosylase [Mesomycoplasma flocculare]